MQPEALQAHSPHSNYHQKSRYKGTSEHRCSQCMLLGRDPLFRKLEASHNDVEPWMDGADDVRGKVLTECRV